MAANNFLIEYVKEKETFLLDTLEVVRRNNKLLFRTRAINPPSNKIKINVVKRENPKEKVFSSEATEYTHLEIHEAEAARHLVHNTPVADEQSALEFMKMDYDNVHKEILNIQNCNSQFFIRVTAISAALAIAILAIFTKQTKTQIHGQDITTFPFYSMIESIVQSNWQIWLPIASLLPIGLLTVAIIINIHKARNFNARSGYLASVSEYIARGIVPNSYCGWPRAKLISSECNALRKYYSSKKEKTPFCKCCTNVKGECNEGDLYCLKEARKFSKKFTTVKPSRPALLNSFTSITTHIYGSWAVLSIIAFLISTYFAAYSRENISFKNFLYIISLGFVNAGFIAFIMKYQIEKKLMKWVSILIFDVILLAMAIWNVITVFPDNSVYELIIYSGTFIVTSIAFACLFFCINMAKSLRKGDDAIEMWRHIWKVRLSHCTLMRRETEPRSFS